ncbi:MAG: hypothetical protein Q8O88_04155 [bacterium]|nr:hypothetical protein [bacterium]
MIPLDKIGTHPIYEYMVGDTVRFVGKDGHKLFTHHIRKPFIIKEALQIFVQPHSGGDGWENHYKGFIKNLGNHCHDEVDIYMCRMVLIEKNKLFINGR